MIIERPKRSLSEYLEYPKLLNKNGLQDQYALVGGLAIEAWRSIVQERFDAGKLPSLKLSPADIYQLGVMIFSKDIDLKGTDAVIQAFRQGLKHKTEKSGRNNELNMSSKTFFDCESAADTFSMFAQKTKSKQIEVLDRLEGVDDEPNGVSQGIITHENVWNDQSKEYQQVPLLDPLSLMLVKLCVSERFMLGENDVRHMNALSLVIPTYLEEKTKDYQKGKIQRNPAILANRLQKRIKTSVKMGRGELSVDQVEKISEICKSTAAGQTEVFYRE